MSTTNLTAGEVMDRAAALLNDPAKTDYTYAAQLPYLNMAIDELIENLEESNNSPSNLTAAVITLTVGQTMITPAENATVPHYPQDLVEIQEVGERRQGNTNDMFVLMNRVEFLQAFPPNDSFLYWSWENQIIKFNPNGALTPRDIQLRYVRQAIAQATNETSVIGAINSRSYLSYKTAALCSMYIGENESRAQALNEQADQALERLIGINNKGRQEMVTRHRPFRAAYKSRGWY